MLRAMELAREIAQTSPFRSHVKEELNPSTSLNSRQELTTWLRATCEHEYHPTCTCRIGAAIRGDGHRPVELTR